MANVDGSAASDFTRRDTGHVNPEMRPTKQDSDRYSAIVKYGVASGKDRDRRPLPDGRSWHHLYTVERA